MMPTLIRICPQCKSERDPTEIHCEGSWNQDTCGWSLFDVPIIAAGTAGGAGQEPQVPASPAMSSPQCANGHSMGSGDQLCMICGSDAVRSHAAPAAEPSQPQATAVDGWRIVETIPDADGPWQRFRVEAADGGKAGLLTLYHQGNEPDMAVQDALRRTHKDHIPELLATGWHEGRTYDVIEDIRGESLAEAGWLGLADPEVLRRVVDELGRAIAQFSEMGLRHRDIQPSTILLRSRHPLDLVITSFGSARLSDFDLEAVSPLELSFYSAPETIVGAVSAASDWWSLGMIFLDQLTEGACFQGIHPKAFHIHVVTRGVDIPANLPPSIRLLLRGLLARDPLRRWDWTKVQAWLSGGAVEAPSDGVSEREAAGPVIVLAGGSFSRPDRFALAAAEAQHWEGSRSLTLQGAVATWLQERGDTKMAAAIRNLGLERELPEDYRHALVLMAMNPSLPLTIAGEIVTPAWLLAHPAEGYELITGKATRHLERMEREPWIVRLRGRAQEVRERARLLDVQLDEERVRVAILNSSRANLEAERERMRLIFPDTDHSGLSSLVERSRLSDEDLIVLVSAALPQFLPLAALREKVRKLADRQKVDLDNEQTMARLVRPRRDLFSDIDGRIVNFARCGIQAIDEWADDFRVERRLPLDRAVVLLAVPETAWKEPPKQQYLANLLEHFEKRISGSVQRGPLTRFSIGKTTPRVDFTDLGTPLRPADALLNHVLSRQLSPLSIDTQPLAQNENLYYRLRRLVSHAQMFRRDSGIDGRYLGFPFLALGRARADIPGSKKRLAPILLWPVIFDMQMATGPATLHFDGEREEVRLNPALEAWLGPVEIAKWKAIREELLGRSNLHLAEVVDAFSSLAVPRGRTLSRVPAADAASVGNGAELVCCAALFNAEFTGQAIAEDLRRMRTLPPTGTGVETLLRIQATPAPPPPTEVREKDRYLTVESDPSQEAAVLRSRAAPGLLVEGPPGTGKSQTIVNMVSDAIGRGETVLIVCQKQPALRVVQKRLEAEGLGGRLFLVVDMNRDRESVIRSLREQLDSIRSPGNRSPSAVRRAREEIAARIEAIEGEIDRHHQAIHAVDDFTGRSYRALLGELVGLESEGPIIPVPRLRARFLPLTGGQLSQLVETCAPLSRLWLASRFEGSPLHALKPFDADEGTRASYREDLEAFAGAEAERQAAYSLPAPGFEIEDDEPYQAWLDDHFPFLEALDLDTRLDLAKWRSEFKPGPDGTSLGTVLLDGLISTDEKLRRLNEAHHRDEIFTVVCGFNSASLQNWLRTINASRADSFWGKLNPKVWLNRRRTRKFLSEKGMETSDSMVASLQLQLALELELMPIRENLRSALMELGLSEGSEIHPLRKIRGLLSDTLKNLRPLPQAALHSYSCPDATLAEDMLKSGSLEGYRSVKSRVDAALSRHYARERCRKALQPLSQWFQDEWMARMRAAIDRGESNLGPLNDIEDASGALGAFQKFRTRIKGADSLTMSAFAHLREREKDLNGIPGEKLQNHLGRILRREALLAWKSRMEQARPELLLEREEIKAKVQTLAELDEKLRQLNKELLAKDVSADRLGSQSEWEEITRLRGPRMKRLREILDRGAELGLFHLRPIWLMNPAVASRILPLKGGRFDLVLYDEASQMPVEYAVPTLFRGKRVVVSGDEKQMPPSSFFSSRIDGGEDSDLGSEQPEDAATEAEKLAQEDTWNRREVKDCPDLLQLSRGVLPSAILEIHYRSRYRELIGFSNHAFYAGRLSVPVRHPDPEILKAKPISVIRVDGVYENQANESEAKRVVDLLAEYWTAPISSRPSIGVVTFNRKQADLIDELIDERGMLDANFLQAFQEEKERTQNGEDMGFFVKNVENVQGDERDIIIFSTTFGRDRHGSFRRNFGVLGQTGGERRLNVAITRARAKVVLVTSIPVPEVSDFLSNGRAPNKPRDFLQAYLDYAQKLGTGNLALARGGVTRLSAQGDRPTGEAHSQDGIALAVARFIRGLGYEPKAAHEADAFGLDFAIEDKRTGLFGIGIECDSPRHDLLVRARAREIWRPKVLYRAIPRVYRVSSLDWYIHGEAEQKKLREAIQAALG
jgi:primosomal replication protein N''